MFRSIIRRAISSIAALAVVSTPVHTAAAEIPISEPEAQLVSFGDSYASNSVIPRGAGSDSSASSHAAYLLGLSRADYAVSTSHAGSGAIGLTPQIDAAISTGALGNNTQVVTISSGGNDAIQGVWTSKEHLDRYFYTSMKRAVHKIRSASPHAKIILVGYPSVTLSGICLIQGLGPIGGGIESMAKVKEVEMNNRQRETAHALGIEFVDMKEKSKGQGLCDLGNPFVSRFIDFRPHGATMPLHLTGRGNADIGKSIAQKIKG